MHISVPAVQPSGQRQDKHYKGVPKHTDEEEYARWKYVKM